MPDSSPPADASSPTGTLPSDASASTSKFGALLSPEGRVFFGKSKSQREDIATDELFVAKVADTDKIRIILGHEGELVARVVKAHDEFVELASETAYEPREPVAVTIYKDGSFEGSKTYKDGSKWEWLRTSYQGIAAEQFRKAMPLEGVLGDTVRFRMRLLRTSPVGILGVYRFPDTRADRELEGTLDVDTRRLSLDDKKAGGHIDAIVIGHLAGAPYTSSLTIVGTYRDSSSTTTRAFKVTDGFYPERIGPVKGGIFLSAQERHSNDCDIVDQHIFPVLDGAPADVTKTFEETFGGIAVVGVSASEKPVPQRLKPGSKIRQNCPKLTAEQWTQRHQETRSLFTASKLRDAWVAIAVEHYYQGGGASGMSWRDCFVVDLATGEREETHKLLTDATVATFEARARKEALAALADAGPPKGDSLVDGMRDAAGNISLKDTTLCIEDKKVVFGVAQHRVFGPGKPEYDRAEFARLLPEGKLKALLTPAMTLTLDAGPSQGAQDGGR